MQHLHVPCERHEERVGMHAHEVSDAARTWGARRKVHPRHPLPRGGRPEHVHVSMERFEEQLHVHELQVLDSPIEA